MIIRAAFLMTAVVCWSSQLLAEGSTEGDNLPPIIAAEPIKKGAIQDNAVIYWNKVTLQAIRNNRKGPTINARALAIVHTCLYDTWATFDNKAVGVYWGDEIKRQKNKTATDKETALSYAAYLCLADLFTGNYPATPATAQGDNLSFFQDMLTSRLGITPSALSSPSVLNDPNFILASQVTKVVLDVTHSDGANQDCSYQENCGSTTGGYKPKNLPLVVYGVNYSTSVQYNIDPDRWQPLIPLASGYTPQNPTPGSMQQFLTPHWGGVDSPFLSDAAQIQAVLNAASLKGPATYVNNPQRYIANAQEIFDLYKTLNDQTKVIAEYWADGPSSETPPGHWSLFAQFVSQRDQNSVDDDAKMFFALQNGLFDASIMAWNVKRQNDFVRPISAIRYLGLHHALRNTGDKGSDYAAASFWVPYQAPTFVTPPFPEYISGHSTFSYAGAQILTLFTNSSKFGYSATFPKGKSLVEPNTTPRNDVTLSWSTFQNAADEAGYSRRYGGIHFAEGDCDGRRMGIEVGLNAWSLAQAYWSGNPPSNKGKSNSPRPSKNVLSADSCPLAGSSNSRGSESRN